MKKQTKHRADTFLNSLNHQNDTYTDGTKPVESPTAQTSGRCRSRTVCDSFKLAFNNVIHESSDLPTDVKYILWILYHTGARVSEVLQIENYDVSNSNDVFIKGGKGSSNRLVRVPLLFGIRLNQLNKQQYIFQDYNRFYIYHLCKARGLYFNKNGNYNAAVSHSFRNVFVQGLMEIVKDRKEVSKAIGHKSNKSLKYYEKDLE